MSAWGAPKPAQRDISARRGNAKAFLVGGKDKKHFPIAAKQKAFPRGAGMP